MKAIASLVLVALLSATASATVNIEMVTVSNPGNAPDTRYNSISVGSVANAYQIGKYEVTAGQYTEFLNAVAKADPNGLYFTPMGDYLYGVGIRRSGSSPYFSYTVATDDADRPVNYVSFWNAARFANWLHNGQPSGSQGPGTTEDGAYHDVGNQALFGRNAGARFFIPTEDEWYKAAYHDKTAGLAASYFDYPTGTNSVPGNDTTESTNPGNNANFQYGVYHGPPWRTEVGEFGLSVSPYGTFDQGGNVWEFTETYFMGFLFPTPRGGAYQDPSGYLLASLRASVYSPTGSGDDLGFRVASIPEPSTLLLLCFGSLAVLWRRRGLLCASILAVAAGATFADHAVADTFGSGANSFDIDFVTIGNPYNAADITGNPIPAGSVAYAYRMGKFEISEQMIDKANTLGGLGITKDSRGIDKPATDVTWNEAARFVNWLNTNMGGMPAYKFALQPGDAGYSANAQIQLWDPADAGYNPNNLYRNSLAHYFLPSVHEWYKAAYYDPTGGVYYNYPTGSDSVPDGIDFAGDPLFDVVFDDGAVGDANPLPNDITNVGGLSPYGTAGQGGNVSEWEETYFYSVNDSSSAERTVRGGSWLFDAVGLNARVRFAVDPTGAGGFNDIGFRVASIPEPASLTLSVMGMMALMLWTGRKQIRQYQ